MFTPDVQFTGKPSQEIRSFRQKGLTKDEATNLVAHLHGIPVSIRTDAADTQRTNIQWSDTQLNRLLELKYRADKGEFEDDSRT